MTRTTISGIGACTLMVLAVAAAPNGRALAGPPATPLSAPIAAPRLQLQPMAQTPHLGSPLRVRLQAGQFAIKSVMVVQQNASWSATSQPEMLHDAAGKASIAFTPLQLGEVQVAVIATLANGLTAERRMTLKVALPEEAPVEFHVNSNDVMFLQKGMTRSLAPVARFAGIAQEVPIDPTLVTFKIAHDDFDDNPSIDVSDQGRVHANGRGSMNVRATFMGKTSSCRIKVLPKLD